MNITDEGLREMTRNLCKSHNALMLEREAGGGCYSCKPIFTALQQVRDAAKKEEREVCAHMVEDYPIPRLWDSVRDDILGGAAKAIRQGEGGK